MLIRHVLTRFQTQSPQLASRSGAPWHFTVPMTSIFSTTLQDVCSAVRMKTLLLWWCVGGKMEGRDSCHAGDGRRETCRQDGCTSSATPSSKAGSPVRHRGFHRRRNDSSRSCSGRTEFETEGGSCKVQSRLKEGQRTRSLEVGVGEGEGSFQEAISRRRGGAVPEIHCPCSEEGVRARCGAHNRDGFIGRSPGLASTFGARTSSFDESPTRASRASEPFSGVASEIASLSSKLAMVEGERDLARRNQNKRPETAAGWWGLPHATTRVLSH